MKRYEYKIYLSASVETLNKLGAEGWELVEVHYVPLAEACVGTLKREIPDPIAEETAKLNLEMLRRLSNEAKKPDFSNASIEKANELLSEAQKKRASPPLAIFANPVIKNPATLSDFAACPGGCQIESVGKEREILTYHYHYIRQGQSYAELKRKDGTTFYNLTMPSNVPLSGAREYIENKFPGLYEIIDLGNSVDVRA